MAVDITEAIFLGGLLGVPIVAAEFGINVFSIFLLLEEKVNYYILAILHAVLIPLLLFVTLGFLGVALNLTIFISMWIIYAGIQAVILGIIVGFFGIGTYYVVHENEDLLFGITFYTVFPFPFTLISLVYATQLISCYWWSNLFLSGTIIFFLSGVLIMIIATVDGLSKR